MAMTADRLLEGIKRRITIPASQVLLQDSDILALADDVIKGYMVPLLVSVRQDFFVTTTETQLVDDQADYAIPYRAIGRGLRDLKLVDANSTTRDVALVPIEDEHRFGQTTTTHSFYFKGDKIILIPPPNNPSVGDVVQIWWENPPARLVALSSAATVTGISGDTITVNSIPSTMTAAVTVDFIQGTSGNGTLAMDTAIASASSATIIFATDAVPDDLAVGDYISLAETSPVIQLPNECYPLLESRTCKRVLMAVGDSDGARGLDDDIKEEDKNLKLLLEPRIQGEPTVIMNRNGLLRGRRFFARRGLLY